MKRFSSQCFASLSLHGRDARYQRSRVVELGQKEVQGLLKVLGGLGLAIALQGCQNWSFFGWDPQEQRLARAAETNPNSSAPSSSAPRSSVKVIPVPLSPIQSSADAVLKFDGGSNNSLPKDSGVHNAVNNPVQSGLKYEVFELPASTVHLVRIPQEAEVKLTVALSTGLTPLSDLAQMVPGAMVAINAGFFDPNNAHSMNFITQNGQKTGDPTQNERLMKNSGIQPYLDKVLNRSEFRRYRCKDGSEYYAINFHNDPIPKNCSLSDSVGGGPQILPRLTATEEAFWAEDKGKVLRDAIGMNRPNARSAIALTARGDILMAMVAQRPPKTQPSPLSSASTPSPSPPTQPSGLSLPELATFLQGQGAVQALNLDGGSSSGLYFAPQSVYGKRDKSGQPIRRAVKSILVVSPR